MIEIFTTEDVTPDILANVNPEKTIILASLNEYKIMFESSGFNISVNTTQHIGLNIKPFSGTTIIPLLYHIPLKVSCPLSILPMFIKPGYIANLGVSYNEHHSCNIDNNITHIIYNDFILKMTYDMATAKHFGKESSGLKAGDELFTYEFALRWNAVSIVEKIMIFIDGEVFNTFENLF